MRVRIAEWPVHPLLLVAAFVLNDGLANEVPVAAFGRPLAVALGACIVLIIGLTFVTGSTAKAGIWSGALILGLISLESDYPFQPGDRPSLLYVGTAFYVAVVFAAAVAAWLAMRRYPAGALFANSWLVVAAVPRVLVYDLTYLLVGAERAIKTMWAYIRRPRSPSPGRQP